VTEQAPRLGGRAHATPRPGHMIRSIVYGLMWVSLGMTSRFPSGWVRRNVLRLLRARIDPSVIVYSGVFVRNPWRLQVGRGTVIGHHCHLDARGGLHIGAHVNLSSEVNIWTNEHDPQSDDFAIVGAPVRVGDHAWLGNRCIILPGVSIGAGAVVCSGAVVTKDVPERAIVGGVPAHVIGQRRSSLSYSPAAFGKVWFA